MTAANPRKRSTIYDVAALAGVSKSLVSLVLQGSQNVSPERREAVNAAIATLGYRPSRAATSLAGSPSKTIGVVIDDFRNLWFVDMLKGLQAEFDAPGYRLVVSDVNLNAHLEQSPIDGFLSMRVEGLVIATEPVGALLDPPMVPTVVAGGRSGRIPGADIVANNDLVGGRLATEHLLALGHTAIGHLSGRGGSAALRLQGYREQMSHAGLVPRISAHLNGTTEIDGYRGALRLLDDHPEITAIFAANDTMAVGSLAALRERGLRAPDDVSVIGYDNSPVSSSLYLDITTIDGCNAELGERAAAAILSRIEVPDRVVREVLIDPRVLVRSSTGRVSPGR